MAKILIVDDDQAVRCVILRMLRGLEHDVIEAANGAEALAFFLSLFVNSKRSVPI
jgi:CheY-like chemotaxis protein